MPNEWEKFFSGKRVTVFGLGLHGGGVGTVRFLAKNGARVTVTDIKSKEQLRPSMEKLKDLKNVGYILGQHRNEDFTKVDMVVVSPAIPWTNAYVKRALDAGVSVEMDSSLFFRFCKNPIIGVTGTKGKTTTATFIHAMLAESNVPTIKVGVGQIPVLSNLEKIKKDTVVVFELSSWRLSALKNVKKSPPIGVFKNLYPDHLNWYKTLEAYLDDKKNIYRYQSPKDWMIVNYDDRTLKGLLDEISSQIVVFSFHKISRSHSVYVDEGVIYLNDGNDERKIVSLKNVDVRGRHTISNILAALGAVYAYGLTVDKMREVVHVCGSVPHRLELVGEVRGVRYYNDTTATIPEAVLSALDSFTQPVVLIAGGSHKGLKYDVFSEAALRKVKKIILLKGSASERMKTSFSKALGENYNESNFPEMHSMEEAVRAASEISESGDVVLLSPAAASFGMFDNEFDRGDQFRSAVNALRDKE